jgi:hypothetical protein
MFYDFEREKKFRHLTGDAGGVAKGANRTFER